jgi:predicted nuclease of predicted toxin-antitoxin system
MKFLIDMNMSPRWGLILSGAGFEAVHWSRVGAANAPDPEIMAHAEAHDFIVLTNDLDFGNMLAATNAAWPSVVQVRVGNLRPHVIGAQVVEALRQMTEELEAGALVTIDPKRTRVRVLPLR